MAVREVTTPAMFNQLLTMSAGAPVCIIFKASWCGACKYILPHFYEFSKYYNGAIIFLEVDVDKVQELFQYFAINYYPTFMLFKGGIKINEFNGADPRRLSEELENLTY
uniref:Thioredoxin-2-like n=1 Tax=Geotrypetes seraphini TaxID=260995 RepID=A0A6P8S2E3_GEOSA|nr:thioredoxin-2-like [Geotrypetes seraphini]